MKRAVLVWHRRAGKDLLLLNATIVKAFERVGTYWHIFPTAKQGRKILWDGVTKDGRPFLAHWPRKLVINRNEAEMKLKLSNGSVWQIVGSDNFQEALIGGNPIGIVFSEYALQNPSCWNYLRPILAENEGWAAFCYTPRGKNHGWDLFKMASENPAWFCQRLTAYETKAISEAAIEQERRDGMPDELVRQEFGCDFTAANVGSYYGKLLEIAEKQGRFVKRLYDPQLAAEVWWDLGMNDMMSLWFVQRLGREIRAIDYYEANGLGLEHFVGVIKDKGYAISRHVVPHDIKVREMGAKGRTRLETLKALTGSARVDNEEDARFVIAPRQPPIERINAVRSILPRCYFDEVMCERGLEGLKQYSRVWDDTRKIYLDEPLHNWCSHPADAFGHGAVMLRDDVPGRVQTVADGEYDALQGAPMSDRDRRGGGRTQEQTSWDPFS